MPRKWRVIRLAITDMNRANWAWCRPSGDLVWCHPEHVAKIQTQNQSAHRDGRAVSSESAPPHFYDENLIGEKGREIQIMERSKLKFTFNFFLIDLLPLSLHREVQSLFNLSLELGPWPQWSATAMLTSTLLSNQCNLQAQELLSYDLGYCVTKALPYYIFRH